MSCESWDSNAQYDIVPRPIPGDHLNPIACYLGDHLERYLTHPYASPLFGDFKGLPPMLIQAGECEVLRDEITLLAHKATLSGLEVRHELYEDAVCNLLFCHSLASFATNVILTLATTRFTCSRHFHSWSPRKERSYLAATSYETSSHNGRAVRHALYRALQRKGWKRKSTTNLHVLSAGMAWRLDHVRRTSRVHRKRNQGSPSSGRRDKPWRHLRARKTNGVGPRGGRHRLLATRRTKARRRTSREIMLQLQSPPAATCVDRKRNSGHR